jgi:hypothetical protein
VKLSEWELDRLETVAWGLAPLQEKVVFLGGSVVGLLLTDPASPPVRPTQDVDVLVETVSYARFASVETTLRALGFEPDQTEGSPICRWLIHGIKVDIMPPDPTALGFSNRWYPETLRSARPYQLRPGVQVELVSPACFLATKLEAFSSRGHGDYLSSADIEDFVVVVDGRAEIPDDVRASVPEIRGFLASECKKLLSSQAFLEALPGHLLGDEASQARAGLVLARLAQISTARGLGR